MHSPEDAKQLYDELAERIRAQDGTGARRVFHELQKSGRSRQEIVAEVSRLIENGSAEKPLGRSTGEIPWLRHQEPSIWSHTPINGPQHRSDISATETSGEAGIRRTDADGQPAGAANEDKSGLVSGTPQQLLTNQKTIAHTENGIPSRELRQGALSENLGPPQIGPDLSVTERAASKLNLKTVLSAGDPEPSAPAETVAAKDQPRLVQRASRSSPRRVGIFLTGISVIATVSAGLFVLWSFYGSEVQDFLSARAPSVLTWLQKIGAGNTGLFSPDDKPRQSTGPQQGGAVDEGNQTPKQTKSSAAQPPADRSIRNPEAAVTEPVVANKQGTRTEPNAGATSTPPSAQIAEEVSSQTEAPTSQVVEPVTVPTAALPRPQQNESDAAQAPQTVARQPPIDASALIAQGDRLLARFDVASARLLYQSAAETGDARGALRMGMTFDPVFLARWRLRGVRGDRAQATAWYRHASALGNADADLMLTSLNRRTEAASRSIPAPAGQVAAPRAKRTRSGPRRATAMQ